MPVYTHAGVRWWLERHPDAAHPVATARGWIRAGYVIEQAQVPGATENVVRAFVEAVLARFEAQCVRTAVRRKALPIAA